MKSGWEEKRQSASAVLTKEELRRAGSATMRRPGFSRLQVGAGRDAHAEPPRRDASIADRLSSLRAQDAKPRERSTPPKALGTLVQGNPQFPPKAYRALRAPKTSFTQDC